MLHPPTVRMVKRDCYRGDLNRSCTAMTCQNRMQNVPFFPTSRTKNIDFKYNLSVIIPRELYKYYCQPADIKWCVSGVQILGERLDFVMVTSSNIYRWCILCQWIFQHFNSIVWTFSYLLLKMIFSWKKWNDYETK